MNKKYICTNCNNVQFQSKKSLVIHRSSVGCKWLPPKQENPTAGEVGMTCFNIDFQYAPMIGNKSAVLSNCLLFKISSEQECTVLMKAIKQEKNLPNNIRTMISCL